MLQRRECPLSANSDLQPNLVSFFERKKKDRLATVSPKSDQVC
jgi:hypothetical protein